VWQAIKEILPIPKDGDSVKTFVVREGICASPYIRVICRIGAIGDAYDGMNKGQATIDQQLGEIDAQYRANEGQVATLTGEINYWASSQPLERLQGERTQLLPNFQRQVHDEMHRRYPEPGIPFREAIESILVADS
jgi:hypothetical protein